MQSVVFIRTPKYPMFSAAMHRLAMNARLRSDELAIAAMGEFTTLAHRYAELGEMKLRDVYEDQPLSPDLERILKGMIDANVIRIQAGGSDLLDPDNRIFLLPGIIDEYRAATCSPQ